MIPLIGEFAELKYVKKIITDTAEAVISEAGVKLEYKVGSHR